jgi:hypothetical protein
MAIGSQGDRARCDSNGGALAITRKTSEWINQATGPDRSPPHGNRKVPSTLAAGEFFNLPDFAGAALGQGTQCFSRQHYTIRSRLGQAHQVRPRADCFAARQRRPRPPRPKGHTLRASRCGGTSFGPRGPWGWGVRKPHLEYLDHRKQHDEHSYRHRHGNPFQPFNPPQERIKSNEHRTLQRAHHDQPSH